MGLWERIADNENGDANPRLFPEGNFTGMKKEDLEVVATNAFMDEMSGRKSSFWEKLANSFKKYT